MTAVVKTTDGISHGQAYTWRDGSHLQTTCGMVFACWVYRGKKQGQRNRRRPVTQIPESATGDVDCMTCLVLAARP